jgi:hypothetical protein
MLATATEEMASVAWRAARSRRAIDWHGRLARSAERLDEPRRRIGVGNGGERQRDGRGGKAGMKLLHDSGLAT